MNGKKKVFCLIGQLGNGGTEKQHSLFLKHLPKNAFEPTVIVSSSKYTNSSQEKQIKDSLGIPVFRLLGNAPAKLAHFAALTLRYRPDIVLSWSFYTNAFCTTCASGKFIGGLRGGIDIAKKELSQTNFKLSLKPKSFIVNSTLLKKQLVAENIPADAIHVIPNMFERYFSRMPTAELKNIKYKLRNEMGIGKSEIIVAGAGRATPEKDFGLFLDTAESALKHAPSMLKFLLLGQCAKTLACEIRKRGLSKRFYLNDAPNGIHQLLPVADIFFLSSASEGMPNILLEAIDAGLLPLCTDTGGVRDILENRDDLILPDRNPENCAVFLIKQLGNKKLMEDTIFELQQNLERFAPENIMPSFISELNEN